MRGEYYMDSAVVFIVMIIALVLIGILGLILYILKVNELFPFRKMNEDDFNNCYDLSYRKNVKKKK